MSLSSTLWSGTGLIHCLVGLAVPELRGPLLRTFRDGRVDSAVHLEDRYARAAAVWFHLFGGLVLLQGLAWRQYVRETKTEELPSWWGWSVTAIGITLGKLMPESGWPIVLAQGLRIVWRNHHQKIKGKEK